MAEEKDEKPVKDIGTALADIQKRSEERKKVRDARNKVISDNRIARMNKKKESQTSGTRLAGLASFASTTGKQTI